MKKGILVLSFILGLSFILKSQPVDLRFIEFEFNNELSSLNITSIVQDDLDFIWFGTNNGLCRFDGYSIKKYLSFDGMTFNIPETNIYSLFNDSYGKIWISLSSKVCYYDYFSDSIYVFSSELGARGLDGYFISNYAENSKAEMFVATINSIFKLNRETNQFVPQLRIPEIEISSFIFDANDDIWVSSKNGKGFYHFSFETQEFKKFNIPGFENISITDLVLYENQLWLSTDGGGVFTYNPITKEYKNYPSDSEYSLNVLELYTDKEDNLWAVDFTGVKLYLKAQDYFHVYYHEEYNSFSPKPYLKSIFQDKHSNYWTIHGSGGIGFSPQPKGITRFDSKMNSPFHLTNNNISTICEDQSGNLWLGNSFNGIDVFNWVKGKTVSYFYEPNNPNSLGKGATQFIYRDSRQEMWIASYWGGLQKYRPQSDDFTSYVHDPDDVNTISSNDIRHISEDAEGNLWLTSHGRGIDKFDIAKGVFKNYNFENNALSNNYTYNSIVDKNGNLWVSTSWGLSVLSPNEQLFETYYFDESDSNSLSSNTVNSVYEDGLGRIWAATNKGLSLFQPITNNFKQFSKGFANKNIVSISEDINHNIWVGTLFGISRLEVETGKVLNLSEKDGLISNVFVPRAIYNNGINTLFFGSEDGLNYFDPLKLKYNVKAPKLYITNVKVLNQEISNHNSKVLDNNIVVTKQITLDYSQKIIEIEFSALNFVDVNSNSYECYLEGFEKEWKNIGNRHSVTYTNLKPRKYIFKVKATNNEGVTTDDGIALVIIIKPPFWLTYWFLAILIFALFVLIIALIRTREYNLKRKNILLENKVKERTKEIISQKNEMEKQKLELEKSDKIKNRFFSVLAHDLRSPVYSLLQLNTMLKERANNLDEKSQKMIDLSIQTANSTYNLLEELLIWGKSQTNNMEFDFKRLNLKELILSTINNFEQISASKNIVIEENIPHTIQVYADSNSIKVVMRNLLSNAIKFSFQNSRISINVEEKINEVVVCVSDKGIGMSEDYIQNIFESQLKYTTIGTSGEKGSGLGLSLSKELIEKNGGKIWAKSVQQEGSTFCFSIPT